MINLLPPGLKEQIHYARLNRLTLRYVRVVAVVLVVLAAIFVWTLHLLSAQAAAVTADVNDKQKTIAQLSNTLLPKAKDASERLNAIKFVQGTQTRFSAVVADIAKVLPQGVSIDSMTLTGNDAQPVRIGVSSTSYDGVLAFRNALTTSPRIAGADIESIAQKPQAGAAAFAASIVIGFLPGKAK